MGNCLTIPSIQHESKPEPKAQPKSSLAECVPSTERPPAYTANEKFVVEEWLARFNLHSVAQLTELAAPTCPFIFKGGSGGEDDVDMQVDQFFESLQQIFESFPNLRFTWDAVKEEGSPPGTVIIKNLQAKGTHTGKPYEFGPYPPISATNIEVLDPPIEAIVTIKDGKVVKYVGDAFGEMSGPPAFYTKIGGILF